MGGGFLSRTAIRVLAHLHRAKNISLAFCLLLGDLPNDTVDAVDGVDRLEVGLPDEALAGELVNLERKDLKCGLWNDW